MIWQDIVISSGQWVFFISLLPTLFSRDLPPYLTSIPTGIILIIIGIAFATLGLINSMLSVFAVGLIWLLIALKKYIINKKEKV